MGSRRPQDKAKKKHAVTGAESGKKQERHLHPHAQVRVDANQTGRTSATKVKNQSFLQMNTFSGSYDQSKLLNSQRKEQLE